MSAGQNVTAPKPSEHRWLVYIPFTAEELAAIEEAEREAAEAQAKAEEREAWLEEAPAIQAEQDAAICELYEMMIGV